MEWVRGRALQVLTIILVIGVTGVPGLANGRDPVRIGMQAGGTFAWVLRAMEHYGIEDELGLDLQATTYATKQATEIALRAGEVEVIVDDFIMVTLMRDGGVPIQAVHPFSLATGGVVVPAASSIQTLADLKGRRIGAASLGDKTLLILRSLAVTNLGFDPQEDAEIMAVAPPLMVRLLAGDDLDAALPYWHFVARMVGSGEYREVEPATAMLEKMGMSADLPILVVAAREDMDTDTLRRFLEGIVEANERMKDDDEIWTIILDEGLYELADRELLAEVRERWENGIPTRWDAGVVDGLVALVRQLSEVAGADVVGVEEIDPAAFTTEHSPLAGGFRSSVSEPVPSGDETAHTVNPYTGVAEAIEEGSRIWIARNCYGCHGTRGGGGMGPNLVDGRWIYGGDDVTVFESISFGRPNGMPPWKDIMSEDEIWKVIAFIRSLDRSSQ